MLSGNPAICAELQEPVALMAREKPKRRKPRGESTEAEHWGGPIRNVCLTVDASGGLKSRSARGPEPISEGGGNASPAREDGRYGEASEAQRRKPGNG